MSDYTNKEVTDKYRNLFLEQKNEDYKSAFKQLKEEFPELIDCGLPKVSIGGIKCEVESLKHSKLRKNYLKIFYNIFPSTYSEIDYRKVSTKLEFGELLEKASRSRYSLVKLEDQ